MLENAWRYLRHIRLRDFTSREKRGFKVFKCLIICYVLQSTRLDWKNDQWEGEASSAHNNGSCFGRKGAMKGWTYILAKKRTNVTKKKENYQLCIIKPKPISYQE